MNIWEPKKGDTDLEVSVEKTTNTMNLQLQFIVKKE